MWVSVLKKLLPSLILVAFVLGLGYFVYQKGYTAGSQKILLEWELDKAAQRDAYDKVVAEYAKREEAHRIESERIAHELAEARNRFALELDSLRSTLEHRLLLSQNRAEVYRRQAESGAASCRDLAGHAARLDRALEEGRDLVRELGETLGLRDQQLKQLGQQILSDRKLLAGENNGKR